MSEHVSGEVAVVGYACVDKDGEGLTFGSSIRRSREGTPNSVTSVCLSA